MAIGSGADSTHVNRTWIAIRNPACGIFLNDPIALDRATIYWSVRPACDPILEL